MRLVQLPADASKWKQFLVAARLGQWHPDRTPLALLPFAPTDFYRGERTFFVKAVALRDWLKLSPGPYLATFANGCFQLRQTHLHRPATARFRLLDELGVPLP